MTQALRFLRAGPGWLQFDIGTIYLTEQKCEAALTRTVAIAFPLRLRFPALSIPDWVRHHKRDYLRKHLRSGEAVYWRVRDGRGWRCQKWRIVTKGSRFGSIRRDWVRGRLRGYDGYGYEHIGSFLSIQSFSGETQRLQNGKEVRRIRGSLCLRARLITSVKRDRAVVGNVVWYYTARACRGDTTKPRVVSASLKCGGPFLKQR